jgi:hypothetical protein
MTESISLARDAAEALRHAEHAANTAMFGDQALDEELTPDDVANVIRTIREAKRFLGDAERQLEDRLAKAMTSKVSADGSFEKKWQPGKTVWDHDFIAPRIAAASRDERVLDTETGVIEGEAEAAVRCIREAAGISYWRVGALRRFGIDPDAVREREGGRFTIRFLTEG